MNRIPAPPRGWKRRRSVVLGLVTALPIVVYFTLGHPVRLLKIAGTIEAAHIPIVTTLVLLLNRRVLPPELAPSWFSFAATLSAGLFFTAFAILYIFGLRG